MAGRANRPAGRQKTTGTRTGSMSRRSPGGARTGRAGKGRGK